MYIIIICIILYYVYYLVYNVTMYIVFSNDVEFVCLSKIHEAGCLDFKRVLCIYKSHGL